MVHVDRLKLGSPNCGQRPYLSRVDDTALALIDKEDLMQILCGQDVTSSGSQEVVKLQHARD
eukprot:2863892-Amphidinium_carterae.1